jgi:hypothetical protein
VACVIPETYQNLSSEIFFHIVVADFKITVQENAVLYFADFVKISDNRNSVIVLCHNSIVLMCFIFRFTVKFFPFFLI